MLCLSIYSGLGYADDGQAYDVYPEPISLAYSNVAAFPLQTGEGSKVGDPPGLALDLLNAVAESLDIRIEYRRLPNSRVLNALTLGEVDGAFSFSYQPDRTQVGVYPFEGPALNRDYRITTISYHLYKLAGNPVSWDGRSFSEVSGSIGINSGYSISRFLEARGLHVEPVPTTWQNLRKLTLGRIQAYAAQSLVTDPLLQRDNFQSVVKIEEPLIIQDYYLIFSYAFYSRHPVLAQKIWQTISNKRSEVWKNQKTQYIGFPQ